MKKADIRCIVCDSILVTINKEDITQDDADMYQASTDCSQGHASIEVIVQDLP